MGRRHDLGHRRRRTLSTTFELVAGSTLAYVTELDVGRDRLLTLLAQQAESVTLEFVGDCDLSERREVVELASEVGALAARGGSLVVGVDDHGHPTGMLDERKAGLLDEATPGTSWGATSLRP